MEYFIEGFLIIWGGVGLRMMGMFIGLVCAACLLVLLGVVITKVVGKLFP